MSACHHHALHVTANLFAGFAGRAEAPLAGDRFVESFVDDAPQG